MKLKVIPNNRNVPESGYDIGYLLTDNWNDWFRFTTLYSLTYFDGRGAEHRIGEIKIGQFAMKGHQVRPKIPNEFETLDSDFFSLGQDSSYYEGVFKLGRDTSDALLDALNDVVRNPEIYSRAKHEPVMYKSLMRSVNERTIVGQFKRILSGDARLTPYSFSYTGPKQLNRDTSSINMNFSVEPDSRPPSNIQVIIGRNGVGKSFLLNAMARALVRPDENVDEDGKFSDDDEFADTFDNPFGNIVSVSFSAFDEFPLVQRKRGSLKAIWYTNVGLRKRKLVTGKDGDSSFKEITQDPGELTEVFIASAKMCVRGEKRQRWLEILSTLESDPIFEEAEVSNLLDLNEEGFGRQAGKLFRRLSSGHKIVLLTVTKLVEKVEERTLVLIDEPEAHLHPPLLSAFIRGLSDLLISRNGVAIIATHSPVVLQEIPKSCVRKLTRHGGKAISELLQVETFAEHVGQLTHEAFGLEVTRSGFYRMIKESVAHDDDFEDVTNKFNDAVGSEGRALISMLLAHRDVDRSEGHE